MRPFLSLDGRTFQRTLVRRLNPLVNSLRDLLPRFGLRSRRVWIVTTRWTGDWRGRGDEYVISQKEILPMPKVVGVESLDESVASPGVMEIGRVTVEKINPDYTEEMLRGLPSDGTPLPEDHAIFWEIEFLEKTGKSYQRRFQLAGTPKMGMLGWSVSLERAPTNDRGRQKELVS